MGRFALLLAVAVSALALPARAANYTFTYTGYVTTVNTGGFGGFSSPWDDPGIVVNAPVSISYTFDSAMPDITPGPDNGAFQAISQLTLTIGPATNTVNYTSPLAGLRTGNDLVFPGFTTDRYGLIANNLGGNSDFLSFQFDDLTYSTFNTDGLPVIQPNPSSFNFTNGELKSNGFIPARINFVLTGIPEPTTLSLLLLPALAICGRRKR